MLCVAIAEVHGEGLAQAAAVEQREELMHHAPVLIPERAGLGPTLQPHEEGGVQQALIREGNAQRGEMNQWDCPFVASLRKSGRPNIRRNRFAGCGVSICFRGAANSLVVKDSAS